MIWRNCGGENIFFGISILAQVERAENSTRMHSIIEYNFYFRILCERKSIKEDFVAGDDGKMIKLALLPNQKINQ